ncbi:MAG: hypothetical protein GY795_36135 [Desulfobacterales bacterium]|nr:hypothetical protein [Desulfobacterales bacterium]
MNHLKSSIDSCEDECEKPSECIEQIYQTAQQFRDCFVGLHKTSLNSSLFFPFRYHLENAAIDWDDFAEDCAVASDPEIRESLIRLANAI